LAALPHPSDIFLSTSKKIFRFSLPRAADFPLKIAVFFSASTLFVVVCVGFFSSICFSEFFSFGLARSSPLSFLHFHDDLVRSQTPLLPVNPKGLRPFHGFSSSVISGSFKLGISNPPCHTIFP